MRKYSSGDGVTFRGMRWVVCSGGRSNRAKKSFEYKINRGAWVEYVEGKRLKPYIF